MNYLNLEKLNVFKRGSHILCILILSLSGKFFVLEKVHSNAGLRVAEI